MTWTFIVNPSAGRGRSPFENVRSATSSAGIEAHFHETTSAEDLRNVATTAVREGSTRFVAVGGDGTANLMVDAVLKACDPDQRPMFAVITAGSGSDFVRTFGRGGEDPAVGVNRLLDPQLYPIDVGVIEGSFGRRYFLNAANVGVAAASVATAARIPKVLGSAKYAAAFWMTLGRFSSADVEVSIGRHQFTGSAINVVVANGQFFGGGLNVAPRASMIDHELDVQVFSGPRRNAFVIMPRLLLGSHLTHTAVRRYVGNDISIACPSDWPVEADGELLGRGPVSISVVEGAIDFVI